MHWLVDETGTIWPAHSEQLRSRLGFARRSLGERETFLVSNLGFVGIRQLRSGLMVRWRPTYVGREALAASIYLVRDQQEQRTVVSSLATEWRNVLHPTIDDAADAMAVCFGTARSTTSGHFIARPRPVESLSPESPLRKAFGAAIDNQLQYDPTGLWAMLQRTVGCRFLLLDPSFATRRFRVLSVGSGYSKFSHKWMSHAQGSDFEDQPDRSYARAVSNGFWTVLDRGQPSVEDVDASLWIPSRGRVIARYTRLVLPLQVGRRRCILSTSELDSIVPAGRSFAQK